jgi:hypothetical protein
VAILLTYGTARVLPARPGRGRSSTAICTRGLTRWKTFRNYTHSEPWFRALLTEGGERLELANV